MAEIVGVRFKRAGRVYYFDSSGINLEVNDYVVVKTARGLELGHVVIAPKQVLASEITEPLQPVVRKAETEDIDHAQETAQKEKEALAECHQLVAKLNQLQKIAQARGQTLPQLALAWVLRDPRMTSALIGASRPEQIAENVAALKAPPLSSDELAQIDRILAG